MAKSDFDWMAVHHRPNPAAFRAQYVAEIRERARLLFNLGYGPAHAATTISAALAWEFDAQVWPRKRPALPPEVRPPSDGVYHQLSPKGLACALYHTGAADRRHGVPIFGVGYML